MRKTIKLVGLVLWVMVLVFPAAVFAKTFSDMAENHWAASAVDDLVNLGVTDGFPDGTFRGDEKINRYEVCVFLAKLADKLGAVDLSEMKNEITQLKADLLTLKKSATGSVGGTEIGGWRTSTHVDAFAKMGNLITTSGSRGPIMGYRLQTTVAQAFSEGTAVAVTLDTMDAGYGGGSQNLGTNLFDVQGQVSIKNSGLEAPVDLLVTVGPGPVRHTDQTGVLPMETGEYFMRPYSGVAANTKLFGLDVTGKVWADSIATSGYFNATGFFVGINYFFGSVAPYLTNLNVEISDLYLRTAGGANLDNKVKLLATADLLPRLKSDFSLGVNATDISSMFVGAHVLLADIWSSGTLLDLSAYSIGSQYINSNFNQTYAGLDVFNRAYANGTIDFGGRLIQAINENWLFTGLGDLRLSSDWGYGVGKTNSSLTVQGGFNYKLAPLADLGLSYRIYQDPNASSNPTTDRAMLGVTYKF